MPNHKNCVIIFFALSIILPHGTALGETFNVSTTQGFRQALQSAASNGQADTIILADGVYKTTDDGSGTFVFLDNENYELTIQGSSPENVHLSGDNTHQVLTFKIVNYLQTIYVVNMSVINGHSQTNGGGITSEEDLNIENCYIMSNSADSRGGGFYTDSKTVKITNSVISGNSANASGGGFYAPDAIVRVTNSTVASNTAMDRSGGGFYASVVHITNSTISNNSAGSEGGGFYAGGTTVTDSTISSNTAGSSGGGFRARSVSINDSEIFENTSRSGGGFISDGTVKVTNCSISSNAAVLSGGGFFAAYSAMIITVTNSTIFNNTAGNDGGGFYAPNANIEVTRSKCSNNSATRSGGGFYAKSGTVTNCIIFENSASASGAGFYAGAASKATTRIVNSLFASNSDSQGVYLGSPETGHYILNSIFLGNESHDVGGGAEVIATIYNNYIDESRITITSFKRDNILGGNLDFVNQDDGDFHLGANSVLIDSGATDVQGITYPSTDFDGNPRLAGASIDIGPYEFSTKPPIITSFTYSGIPIVGSGITFKTDATPCEGRTIVKYETDFGDGVYVITAATQTHTYTVAGNYSATMRVTDSEGFSSTKTIVISIAELPSKNQGTFYIIPSRRGGAAVIYLQ